MITTWDGVGSGSFYKMRINIQVSIQQQQITNKINYLHIENYLQ